MRTRRCEKAMEASVLHPRDPARELFDRSVCAC